MSALDPHNTSLRLAPLDTSSAREHVPCVQPPVSPPPRSAADWRSTSPTAVLPLPHAQLARSAIPIEALTLPVPPLPITPLHVAQPPTRFSRAVPDLRPRTIARLKAVRRKRARDGAPRELFRCTFANCDKVSSEHSNLKAHMRLHTGETPYACVRPGCGKRFRWKSSLTYHEKALHSNLRPYACHACHKRFVEKRKLQLHLDWCPTRQQQALQQRAEQSAAFDAPRVLLHAIDLQQQRALVPPVASVDRQ